MNEIKKEMDDDLKKLIQDHIPLILKCGCGIFHPVDDYPFVTCSKCGWINCGTKEELDKARKNGTLMKTLKWSELTKEEREIINKKDRDFEIAQEEAMMEEEDSLERELEEYYDEYGSI